MMRRKPVWKELEECARQRERYVQRSWSIKESDLFKRKEARTLRGRGGEQSVVCGHAFVERNMDFSLSVIGSYLRVLSRKVT